MYQRCRGECISSFVSITDFCSTQWSLMSSVNHMRHNRAWLTTGSPRTHVRGFRSFTNWSGVCHCVVPHLTLEPKACPGLSASTHFGQWVSRGTKKHNTLEDEAHASETFTTSVSVSSDPQFIRQRQ
jgi:hypothetical protein